MTGAWCGPAVGNWASPLDRTAYTAGVRRVRKRIATGDVRRASPRRVLSAPLPDPAAADVDALAALLTRGDPAPCAGTVRLPAHGIEVATAPPVLYLRRTGRTVEFGPIGGPGVRRVTCGARTTPKT